MTTPISTADNHPSENDNNNTDLLLQTVQSLVEQEQKLTTLLEKHKPLLTLPTPKTLSDVDEILALARTYSTRTSAPPGWNPSLPVVHFATPNPLPHQLRQGALGAMQLKLVRDERKLKRRRKKEEPLATLATAEGMCSLSMHEIERVPEPHCSLCSHSV